MLNLFKKKDRVSKEAGGQKVDLKKVSLGFNVDENRIRVLPAKFLPQRKSLSSKYKLIIIIISALIVVLGVFTALLFNKGFSSFLFGEKEESFVGEEAFLSGQGEGQTSNSSGLEGLSEDGEEGGGLDGESPRLFRKEVLDEKGVLAGVIVFETREELEYLDLKVAATLPEQEIISDENNNKFKIIGGVYLFDPGGVRLSEGDLKVEIFYNKNLLLNLKARDLKVLNWEAEPALKILPGEVKETEDQVDILVNVLPKGKVALAVLTEGGLDGKQSAEGVSVIEPVGALPSSQDSDNDDLTDEEEVLYETEPELGDSDSDGLGDGEEVLTWYEVRAGEVPDSHLDVYKSESEQYSLYYPVLWTIDETQEGTVSFVSGKTGEFIRVMIQENPKTLGAREWYLEQAVGVSKEQVKVGEINGLETAWSLDQFTAYVAKGDKIYLINYNVGLKDEAGFKTTFEGVTQSFHFPADLITGYKYTNEEYGFTLDLPVEWAGYDVVSYQHNWGEGLKSKSLIFRLTSAHPEECTPYDKCAIFFIDIFDFTTWDAVRLLDTAPLLVNVNNDYVFAYRESTYYASDLRDRVGEVEGVIETFGFE